MRRHRHTSCSHRCIQMHTSTRARPYSPTTHLAAAQYTVHTRACTQTQHTQTGSGCQARTSWPLPTTPSPFTGPEAESPSSGSSVSYPLLCSLLPTQQPLPRKFHPPPPGLALLWAAPPPTHAASLWIGLRTGAKQGRVGAWRRAGPFSSFLRKHWGSCRANGL